MTSRPFVVAEPEIRPLEMAATEVDFHGQTHAGDLSD